MVASQALLEHKYARRQPTESVGVLPDLEGGRVRTSL